MDLNIVWWTLAVLLVIGGLAGTILPAMPGVPMIFAGLLLAAWITGFEPAGAGTIAVLLPATAYSLRKPYARARQMIDGGLPVALASDCNPGSSYTESMPFAIGLGVMNMLLTPAEALTAATLNSAYAIDMADRVGSMPSASAFCMWW
mgnify:CR=1 FL=1